ncbi:hypothetical protein LTR86_002556 [Recurvomyces mirabilis]|nr:hypothetical protein LTR86_002556 [Recurvomyces mirabilis]
MEGVAWDRLVRYISGNDGMEHYGQPILSSANEDIGLLARDGKLKVLECDGNNALDAKPTRREDQVKRLLGPLQPKEVPIIRCIGLNYKTHIRETGRPLPECPTIFTKPAPSVADHDSPVPIPKIAQSQCDYEGELTVLIGHDAKDITEANALNYVAGYTCGNDVSARDWQREAGKAGVVPQWTFSKSFDKYAPLGPCLVSSKVLDDAAHQDLSTIVNGEVRQQGNTADLCFGVRQLVAYCSQGQTLQRGSLIMTGTPGGVGLFMKPPTFLRDGDVVEVSIGGKTCEIPTKSKRVSKRVTRPHVTAESTGGDDMSRDLAFPELEDIMIDGQGNEILTLDGPLTGVFEESPAVLPPYDEPSLNSSQHTFEDYLSSATQSWPWLHESLYLQDGPVMSLPPRQDLQSHIPFLGESEAHDTLEGIVESLVASAATVASAPETSHHPQIEWAKYSERLAKLRGDMVDLFSGSNHILDIFVAHHMSDFNPLWPLFVEDAVQAEHLHPILYLTLTSIGAMYGTSDDQAFGTLMHQRLRRLLAAGLFDLEGGAEDVIWLGQSRLLTQVAALYFGQRQAFSYAQHIGAILAAQARRMNLFQELEPSTATVRTDRLLKSERRMWLRAESRRRLAFGLLRADVFNSVLLNTRPVLSYEEFQITLPRSNYLYQNTGQLTEEQLYVAQQFEDDRQSEHNFGDLVRVCLEQDEDLPELNQVGYELCLFGLQVSIWSCSQDLDLVHRLTGRAFIMQDTCNQSRNQGDVLDTSLAAQLHEQSSLGARPAEKPPTRPFDRTKDALDTDSRRMRDLHRDYVRVENALRSWRKDLRRSRLEPVRDTRMSSMLLYHISYMRLSAPLQDLHAVSYHASEQSDIVRPSLRKCHRWLRSAQTEQALTHAWSIWSIMQEEHARPPVQRARFNLLSFLGLHHAAVILWTVGPPLKYCPAGTHDMDRTGAWLQECASLFDTLSPLGGASFGAAARKLSKQPFPRNLAFEGDML